MNPVNPVNPLKRKRSMLGVSTKAGGPGQWVVYYFKCLWSSHSTIDSEQFYSKGKQARLMSSLLLRCLWSHPFNKRQRTISYSLPRAWNKKIAERQHFKNCLWRGIKMFDSYFALHLFKRFRFQHEASSVFELPEKNIRFQNCKSTQRKNCPSLAVVCF